MKTVQQTKPAMTIHSLNGMGLMVFYSRTKPKEQRTLSAGDICANPALLSSFPKKQQDYLLRVASFEASGQVNNLK